MMEEAGRNDIEQVWRYGSYSALTAALGLKPVAMSRHEMLLIRNGIMKHKCGTDRKGNRETLMEEVVSFSSQLQDND